MTMNVDGGVFPAGAGSPGRARGRGWRAIVAAVLVFVGQVNLFEAYIDSVLVGQILTALVAGGGANLIHDIFDKPPVEG